MNEPRRPSLVEGCKTCDKQYAEHGNKSVFAPSHNPSKRCKSGSYPHCTCDTCF